MVVEIEPQAPVQAHEQEGLFEIWAPMAEASTRDTFCDEGGLQKALFIAIKS